MAQYRGRTQRAVKGYGFGVSSHCSSKATLAGSRCTLYRPLLFEVGPPCQSNGTDMFVRGRSQQILGCPALVHEEGDAAVVSHQRCGDALLFQVPPHTFLVGETGL
jgi:hypothetical protein